MSGYPSVSDSGFSASKAGEFKSHIIPKSMVRFSIKRSKPQTVVEEAKEPLTPVQSSDSETPNEFNEAFAAPKRNEVVQVP